VKNVMTEIATSEESNGSKRGLWEHSGSPSVLFMHRFLLFLTMHSWSVEQRLHLPPSHTNPGTQFHDSLHVPPSNCCRSIEVSWCVT